MKVDGGTSSTMQNVFESAAPQVILKPSDSTQKRRSVRERQIILAFADLQQKEIAEVEAMYETVLSQLSATESQLLELYKKKKFIRRPSNSP